MDYKSGMTLYALAFLLGVITVQQFAVLPSVSSLTVLFLLFIAGVVVFVILVRKKRLGYKSGYTLVISLISLYLIGIMYCIIHAGEALSLRLDERISGQNILIQGRVSNIPVNDGKVSRFEFDVDSYRLPATAAGWQSADFPRRIRLSWHSGEPVDAGERWQLEVRLKPPHGFMNPGGFDYEAWLFQHGIHATGYVRQSAQNRLQQEAPLSVNRLRQAIARYIDHIASDTAATDSKSFALVKALAIGDKSSISVQQWHVLTGTGTSHLMAISGLHIGLASLFAYVLIRWCIPVHIMKRCPAQHVALAGGMLAAFCYALIAGLSIPTQRAVIMLSVLCAMLLIRRNHRPVDALGFALIAVLIADPLSVLSAGFWFSFSAVAVIFISLRSDDLPEAQEAASGEYSFRWRVLSILKHWLRLQLLISLFLLPLSLFMFQQVSLISPVANLLLIPYVSFLVVPLVLAAIIFSFPAPYISHLLFDLAAWLLDLIWPLLVFLSELPYSLWVKGDIGIFELLAASAGMLLVFYSNKLPVYFAVSSGSTSHHSKTHGRERLLIGFTGCLLFIPLLITHDEPVSSGDFRLTVLDVGQGSAAVIRTLNHVAVFDSGAKFSERLDVGSSVVLPYLRSQGINQLDRLIISHGDADHIGGAQAILNEFPDALLMGQDIGKIQAERKQVCSAGLHWQWDGVDFVFLSPTSSDAMVSQGNTRNNHSCVLRVASGSGSVLFTGDIEKATETTLLENHEKKLASDILIVPHHGSNTSSSSAFLSAVNPEISIISVGYRNRYRLPNRQVIERYRTMDMRFLQTDQTGAITIKLEQGFGFSIEKYRVKAAKYWHHMGAP
jgi:competence protein ComEC